MYDRLSENRNCTINTIEEKVVNDNILCDVVVLFCFAYETDTNFDS